MKHKYQVCQEFHKKTQGLFHEGFRGNKMTATSRNIYIDEEYKGSGKYKIKGRPKEMQKVRYIC